MTVSHDKIVDIRIDIRKVVLQNLISGSDSTSGITVTEA